MLVLKWNYCKKFHIRLNFRAIFFSICIINLFFALSQIDISGFADYTTYLFYDKTITYLKRVIKLALSKTNKTMSFPKSSLRIIYGNFNCTSEFFLKSCTSSIHHLNIHRSLTGLFWLFMVLLAMKFSNI